MKNVLKVLGIGVAIAASATMASATTLTNGGDVTPNTVATFAFTPIASTGVMTYSYGGGADSGLVIEDVGTWAGNPFGANDLTFVYQVGVEAGDIQHLSGFNFGTGQYSIDVEQFKDGGTNSATDASLNFGVVEFNFLDGHALTSAVGNNISYQLIVNTNATSYGPGTIGLIDGGGTTKDGFAPATPEPNSLALLGTGLLGAAGIARRRFLKK